jgi:hypothetical protein
VIDLRFPVFEELHPVRLSGRRHHYSQILRRAYIFLCGVPPHPALSPRIGGEGAVSPYYFAKIDICRGIDRDEIQSGARLTRLG